MQYSRVLLAAPSTNSQSKIARKGSPIAVSIGESPSWQGTGLVGIV